ncbi:MAG: oligosaccharide flippase family protein [Patescibacteria group bacterium]|nr:oligosaccharide flippase family protein [Patescibacteria group bacterium]
MAFAAVKKKAFTGVSVLVLRNLLIQPISFFGFILLSIFLERWQLGVFWAVSEIVGFLGYFSDIGLAAALIQKKKKPKKEEIRSIFTIQQALVGTLILLAIIFTPFLQAKFNFDDQGKVLFYALLFGFLAASLKTIPSVLLERELKFVKLATVDLIEQLVFTGLAVFFAWRGFGISSWVIAVLARSLIGVCLIYLFSPWPVGFNFNFAGVKKLFNFGVPFQLNSLLATVKDRLVNIFLWGVLGSDGVGILGWAQKWSSMPLRFLMDSVIRVTFPAYSRIQKDKSKLKLALERSGFLVNLFTFPVLAGMGLAMPKVITVFPQYQKWSVALVPFWWYLANFAFGVATTPLVNAFNAVGKVKTSLNLMIFWTVLTWLLVPPLAKLWGPSGASMGFFLVSASSFVAWRLIKKEFAVSLKKIIGKPFLLTMLMVCFLFFIGLVIPETVLGLSIFVISGGLIYGLAVWFFAKGDLVWFLKSLSLLSGRK